MNRKYICGPISSLVPGKKGETGPRARVTFIATYTYGIESEDFTLMQLKYENETITTSTSLTYSTPVDENGNQIEITYPQLKIEGMVTNPEDSSTTGLSGDILKWDKAWKKDTPTSPSSLASDQTIRPNHKFYERTVDEIDSSTGYIAKIKNAFIQIQCDGLESKNPKIKAHLPVDPEPYDYILFVDRNSTYILLISSVEYGDYHTPTKCYCKIIDVWRKPSNEAQQITDVSEITDTINIYCTKYDMGYKTLSDQQYTSYDKTPSLENVHSFDTLRNFLITSKNTNKPIGNYKIELDFISDYNTTLCSSIIKDKFSSNDNYFFGDIKKYNRDRETDGEFNGMSFDAEKLDSFTVTIKDYNDGVGELTYNSTVTIPIKLLKAEANHYKNVHLYIYYKKLNGAINKTLVATMTAQQFIDWNDADTIA